MNTKKYDVVIVGAHWRTPHLSLWRYWNLRLFTPQHVKWICVDIVQDEVTKKVLGEKENVELVCVDEENRFTGLNGEVFKYGVDYSINNYTSDFIMTLHSDAWPIHLGWFEECRRRITNTCRATGCGFFPNPKMPNRRLTLRPCYLFLPTDDIIKYNYDWLSHDWHRSSNLEELGITVWDATEKISMDIQDRGCTISPLNDKHSCSWFFHKGRTTTNQNELQKHIDATLRLWYKEQVGKLPEEQGCKRYF